MLNYKLLGGSQFAYLFSVFTLIIFKKEQVRFKYLDDVLN